MHQSSGDDEIRPDVVRFVEVRSTRMEAVLTILEMGRSLHVLKSVTYPYKILEISSDRDRLLEIGITFFFSFNILV